MTTPDENRQDIKDLRKEVQDVNKTVAKLAVTVQSLVVCVERVIKWAMMISAPLVVAIVGYIASRLVG